jgi:hypothetical protein
MHPGLSEWGARLAALAEFEPPRDGWQAIKAARQRRQGARSRHWPVAIAATALAAVSGLAWQLQFAERELVMRDAPASGAIYDGGNTMRAENARLEMLLASLPEMRAMRGSTAFTLSQLEDRLAFVDDRLSRIALEPNAPELADRLWRERVELMNSLVKVRYADFASPH